MKKSIYTAILLLIATLPRQLAFGKSNDISEIGSRHLASESHRVVVPNPDEPFLWVILNSQEFSGANPQETKLKIQSWLATLNLSAANYIDYNSIDFLSFHQRENKNGGIHLFHDLTYSKKRDDALKAIRAIGCVKEVNLISETFAPKMTPTGTEEFQRVATPDTIDISLKDGMFIYDDQAKRFSEILSFGFDMEDYRNKDHLGSIALTITGSVARAQFTQAQLEQAMKILSESAPKGGIQSMKLDYKVMIESN